MPYSIDNGEVISGIILNSDSMTIYESGLAKEITVNGNGSMTISGGTAADTTVNSGGRLTISGSGVAARTAVNAGEMFLYSGGTAGDTTVDSGGWLRIFGSGTATGTTVDGSGHMIVSGGTAVSTTLNASGSLQITGDGIATGTVVNSGNMVLHSGGTAAETTVNSGSVLLVSAAAVSTTVNARGRLNVSNGGTATGAVVNISGALTVISGGTAVNAVINGTGDVSSIGRMHVSSGGTASNIAVHGGYLYVSGGTADSVTVDSSGHMNVSGAGTVTGVTVVSAGVLNVFGLATVNDITVGSGGSMNVSSGGKAAGTLTIADGAVVSAYEGSIIDFDISGGTAGSPALVNDLSLIQGTPDYTITVAGDQANGVYTLAEGAGAFDSAVSLTVGDNTYYDVLTVGNSYAVAGQNYTLGLDGGNTLTLTVTGGSAPGPADPYVISGLVLIDSSYNVSSGYTVLDTQVSSGGQLIVSGGGTATGTTVNYGGWMNVSRGGTANSTTVNEWGYLCVSGGTATGTTVNSYGYLYVSSGGTANSTTVNGGWLCVSGGTATGTTVNSGGEMYVLSGGTATNIVENGGYVRVDEGANVTFTPNAFSGLVLSYGNSATVHSGTTANNTTVNDSGWLYVSSGGTANSTTVNNGWLVVWSGGTALNIMENGGYVWVGDNANVTFIPNAFSGLVLSYGQSATVHSGTTAVSTTVNEWGRMYVSGGGTANSTTVNYDGWMYVSSGGTANRTTVNSGWMDVSSGGTAVSTTVNGGRMDVSSGGTAVSTTVNGGSMNVSTGGTANITTVNNSGCLYVYSGGTALNIDWTPCVGYVWADAGAYVTYVSSYSGVYFGSNNQLLSHAASMDGKTVNYKGSMYVMSGGNANSTTINDGGYLYVSSGGTATGTTVNEWGFMYVSSGGTANSTTVNDWGSMSVSGGGVANSTTVNGGSMRVSSGGKVTGSLQIASGATVYANDGSIIDFDISGRTAGSAALVNDLSLIQGTPDYTITVAGDQANGVYTLAEGAAGFSGTLSIGTAETNYGTVTVNGQGLALQDGSAVFTLAVSGDSLKLTVGSKIVTCPEVLSVAADITDFTNQNVVVTALFSDDATIRQYSFDCKEWCHYTAPGIVFTENGTVWFRAGNEAGNYSTVASYTVDNIDKIAPTVSISGDPTSWTKDNVALTANFSDTGSGISARQYSFDGTNWQSYTGQVTVSENRTVYFKATDIAGNSATQSVTVTKIDKTAPTVSISGNPASWTKDSVALTANFSDTGSGISAKQYSFNATVWQDYTEPVIVDQNRTIYFKATDTAGNITTQNVVVNKIDKSAPVLGVNLEASYAAQTDTLTITWDAATDNGQLAGYKVTVADKTYETTATTLTIESPAVGTYEYFLEAFDTAGNSAKSMTKSITVTGNNPPGQNYSVFTWSGNTTAYVQEPYVTRSDFVLTITGTGEQDLIWTNPNLIDAEKDSQNYENYILYLNTCWAGTASNMFVRAGWNEGIFVSEDEVLSYFASSFTTPLSYSIGSTRYPAITGGCAQFGVEWLLGGRFSYWDDTYYSWSGPASASTGGFYKSIANTNTMSSYLIGTSIKLFSDGSNGFYSYVPTTGYSYRHVSVNSSLAMLDEAFSYLQNGYAVGLSLGWYDTGLTNRDGGHAITVYGFAYNESKKGKPGYFTGIFVADSDDDKLSNYSRYLNGTPASQSPNRVKYLPIEYNSARGVYVFSDYGTNGVIEGFQYLIQRPENITCSLSSNVGFSSNAAWNSSYSVGSSAEAAVSGGQDGRITAADHLFIALNLANSGLGVLSSVDITAVIDGDAENPLTFTVSKDLSYEESDAETVIDLGQIGSGMHDIVITVSADDISSSMTISNLYVSAANTISREFSASADCGSSNLELQSGDLLSVLADGLATGCVVTANCEQNVKENGTSIGSMIYADGIMTVDAGGSAEDSEIFDSGVLIVNGSVGGSVVHSGGALFAEQNSEVTGTSIEAGGWMNINHQGSADETEVYGSLFVVNGIAGNTRVCANGSLFVSDTGAAEKTVVLNSGRLQVTSGGSAAGTTLTGADSELFVSGPGSIATGNQLDGASQIVADGGIVDDSVLRNGAVQSLYGGAAAVNTGLSAGSLQYVRESTVYSTVIGAGCTSFIYKDSLAAASTVMADGCIVVGDLEGDRGAGTVYDLTVEYGGSALLEEGAGVSGTNRIAGTLSVDGNAAGIARGFDDVSPSIIFDFTERSLADGYMVTNIDKLSDLNFSILLDEEQILGEYKFATKGSAEYSTGFTVVGGDGVARGTLSAGSELVFGGLLITLQETDTDISLSVAENTYRPNEIPYSTLKTDGGSCSWGHIDQNGGYVVQFSRDDFQTAVTIEIAEEAVSVSNLPYEIQWRVRSRNSDVWTEGEDLQANAAGNGSLVSLSKNWQHDVLFTQPSEQWGQYYAAMHLGESGGWNGTGEVVYLNGKNRFSNIFEASSDANVLLLTDDANGDVLFVDDIFSVFPNELEAQARLAKIDEIRAGAGDDLIDLTSQRFFYDGDGLLVRGGSGNDTIWANKGENSLFGDAGNDRLVGASGNDVLAGGSGDDSMHGGGGSDIFAFGGAWGSDTVEQLADGDVTLWFESGSLDNWNAATLTYKDGTGSVKVSGVTADKVSLKFGDDGSDLYQQLSASGAFADFVSENIFEKQNNGFLA